MAECVSDAILLERFVQGREEAAFDALVQRHGPLVEQVCRRILRNDHDVEDVFQATFLLLARKAPVIPWRDSVGGWLGAVAHRLALHTRSGAARRWGRETPLSGLEERVSGNGDSGLAERYHPLVDPSREVERRDLRRVLDDELLRLPEKYRAPVVLCDLEGWTHDEAARQLGWPAGSMSRRLGRARRLLRNRLLHRGLALTAIGLVSAAIAALGTGRPIDRTPRTLLVRTAMAPFQGRGEGGQGLGLVLTALARAEQPLPEASQVRLLAHQAARSAARVADHDPGWLHDQWRQSASAMETAALELAQATEEHDQLAMLAAARRLDASCLKCHILFR
jgi:RNA polymerase sigma-70 factor (ECF subfamily)